MHEERAEKICDVLVALQPPHDPALPVFCCVLPVPQLDHGLFGIQAPGKQVLVVWAELHAGHRRRVSIKERAQQVARAEVPQATQPISAS